MFGRILIVFVEIVLIVCRDINENERASRAAFIQRLLNKQKFLEGRIKLLGGSNIYEGNVYIFHAGRWGAVCDDSWDDASAHVACRAFNRTGVATRGGFFGEAVAKYWMDDVVCDGDEETLSQCVFTGWGSSDCEATEAAGVKCTEITDNMKPSNLNKKPTKRLHEVIDIRTSIRLAGGRSSSEGRVEIYHNERWGSICPDGWTLYEASAVCRHLALGYAEQALQTDYFGSSKIILSGVQCEGNETNLYICKHQAIGEVTCPGKIDHVAAVICTRQLADLLLDTLAIQRSSHLQDVPLFQLQCAMEENCLSKSAYQYCSKYTVTLDKYASPKCSEVPPLYLSYFWNITLLIQKTNPDWQFETRRLLRFTASSLNIGNADFRPYLPKHLWQWHLCHMHYHSMEVFANFDILDADGRRVAEGHKASFCLEDNTCMLGVEKKYSCKNYGDQGVTVNCSDIYQYNVDCQWVDVTDVQPGTYTFKVSVNPHARVAEQNYHNNAASCVLRLTDTYALVYDCRLSRP